MSDLDYLSKILPNLSGLEYSPENLKKLLIYARLLIKWNHAFNLVGTDNFEILTTELLADSLHLAKFLNDLAPSFNGITWDVGAGAGLPGIPLRIFWQKGH